MSAVSHEFLRRVLECHLPHAVLLLGPKGVGKWALGDHLFKFHNIQSADLLKTPYLNVQAARAIRAFSQREPSGPTQGFLINVDRPARVHRRTHEMALNALLKTLEETTRAKFILIASSPPLPTVSSRVITHRVGLLDDDAVAQILLRRGRNVSVEIASKLNGSTVGIDFLEKEEFLKSSVDSMLKALQERDRDLYHQSIAAWKVPEDGEVGLRMLKGWLYEALIGKWHRYSPEAAPELAQDRVLLKDILLCLNNFEGNPKIIARVALDKFLGA